MTIPLFRSLDSAAMAKDMECFRFRSLPRDPLHGDVGSNEPSHCRVAVRGHVSCET
jgi:hypothetical protein